MGIGGAGISPKVAQQLAQTQAANRANSSANVSNNQSTVGQGPRAAVFANATAQANTPAAAPAAPAAPGAPGISPSGTTAATSPLATARAAAVAPNQAQSLGQLAGALAMATNPRVMINIASQGAMLETRDGNKDKVSKDINRATRIGAESTQALKQTETAMGGDVDSANGAANSTNAPAA